MRAIFQILFECLAIVAGVIFAWSPIDDGVVDFRYAVAAFIMWGVSLCLKNLKK